MSFTQDERFYSETQDTVKNCPIGDLQSQAEQSRLKQSLANGSSQCSNYKAKGGNPAPLPYRWFNPKCGCAGCPERCPLRYGADLSKISASGFLGNCGCSMRQRGGCGCGLTSEELSGGGCGCGLVNGEQTGGGPLPRSSSYEARGAGPMGAPLYITSPAYQQLYPNAQNTKPGGFPPLKYNFTQTDGVQFVPIKRNT